MKEVRYRSLIWQDVQGKGRGKIMKRKGKARGRKENMTKGRRSEVQGEEINKKSLKIR